MATSKNPRVAAVMQVLITLVLLCAGLLILTAPNFAFAAAFSDGLQKIAAG